MHRKYAWWGRLWCAVPLVCCAARQVAVMKLDAQGSEPAILRGLQHSIAAQVRPYAPASA